jgi:CysZ protein
VNKYVVLVTLSPVLAYASELAEEKLTGRTYPFSALQLVKDTGRGILIAIRNGVLELTISLVLWTMTFFVPVLLPFSTLALFGVSAYFYGFSMFDYAFERRRMRVGESVRAAHANLGLVLAIGTLFSLIGKLWVVGLVCVPLMAAVGATIALVEKEQATTGRPGA